MKYRIFLSKLKNINKHFLILTPLQEGVGGLGETVLRFLEFGISLGVTLSYKLYSCY